MGVPYRFAHDLHAELPNQNLSSIPANWFDGRRGVEFSKEAMIRIRFQEPENITSLLSNLASLEKELQDEYEKSTFNRLDGVDFFLEFGRVGKFLFIYDTEKHASGMKFLDHFESITYFLRRVSHVVKQEGNYELRHFSPDEISSFLEESELKSEEIANLYSLMPMQNLKQAILGRPDGKEILLASESHKSSVTDAWDHREVHSQFLRPKREREEAIRAHLNEVRHLLRAQLLDEVIEDLEKGTLICTRCGNKKFKVKHAVAEKPGYVICNLCGLSIFERPAAEPEVSSETYRQYYEHLSGLCMIVGAEKSSMLFGMLREKEIEEITRILAASERFMPEEQVYEYFLGKHPFSLALQRTFLENLVDYDREMRFRLADLKRIARRSASA